MKKIAVALLFLTAACQQPEPAKTNTIIADAVDIPRERTVVKKEAVAEYRTSKAGGPNGGFSVQLFQTRKPHKFLMRLENNGFVDQDTFTVPAFTPDPVVEIKPGEVASECIAGFLNKEGTFMPYKKVISSASGVQVKILKRYGTSTYRVN